VRLIASVVLPLVVALPLAASGEQRAAELLLGTEAAYARVTGYTARFAKEERVGGVMRPREEAVLKFQRPGRLYLRWTAGPPRGREILYVPGANGDRLLVHEPGALSRAFTFLLAPDSPRILEESRHPVTDVGIGKVVGRVVTDVKRGLGRGELSLTDQGDDHEAGRRVRRIEMTADRQASERYYAHRVIVDIDADLGLPVAVTAFDVEDRLVGRYEYRDVRLDARLAAMDFDPDNPEYGFPRWRLPL
jgi:outer membrane lipoprotein-sorting protein